MELKDICAYVKDKIDTDFYKLEDYVSTENMSSYKGGITLASAVPAGKATQYKKNDILISNIRPYFKKIWKASKDGICSGDVLCIRHSQDTDPTYLYYLLSQDLFFDYVMSGVKGTKMPRGDKNQIMRFNVKDMPFSDQRRIASILSSLDRKIELNNKINAQLEEMAQAIFKSWFVDFEPFKDGKFVESELGLIPDGWEVGTLTEIAKYVNGLAMQKFPPASFEESLPVLKIKELGQGSTDTNSDRCTSAIKEDFIINDGDVVFSWSGTLLVDIWCGGKCGLNQHLFKVTSESYPKWFYCYWTKYHLAKFIRIAKDKAVTMGHIKRGELENSMVLIPSDGDMAKISNLMGPLVENFISNRVQNRHLAQLRDTLLPKLMNGEIEI